MKNKSVSQTVSFQNQLFVVLFFLNAQEKCYLHIINILTYRPLMYVGTFSRYV